MTDVTAKSHSLDSAGARSAPRAPIVHLDAPANGIVSSPATIISGWIAVEGATPLERVSLVDSRGVHVPLGLVDRQDVRKAVPGMTSTGFTGWLDLRAAAASPWNIRYLRDGRSSDVELPLLIDSSEAPRFTRIKKRKLIDLRNLLRCPYCHGVLTDDAGPVLRCESQHVFRLGNDAFDFLDADLRERVGAVPTENLSAHGYDATLIEMIDQSTGPVLDVGAGLRPSYREDVINLDIVAYPTTDVIAASEYLPFADDSFDLVISVAVLEHVRDPFTAARELMRILKPRGRIFAAVPFLQPYHAYPDHYYNMTSGGLRNIFRDLDVERLYVPQSGGPIFALTWMLQLWRNALPPESAAAFENMRVADLAVDPMQLVNMPFVTDVSEQANVKLAALNVLIGRKPG